MEQWSNMYIHMQQSEMQGYQVQIYTVAVRVTKPWIISILTEAVSQRILSIETVMKGF